LIPSGVKAEGYDYTAKNYSLPFACLFQLQLYTFIFRYYNQNNKKKNRSKKQHNLEEHKRRNNSDWKLQRDLSVIESSSYLLN